MTPFQQLLGDVHKCEAADVVGLLALAAALQSALLLAFQQQSGMPDADHLLSTEQVAARLGRSTKLVRENAHDLPFAIRSHRFSVRGLEEWIAEQRADKMSSALPPIRRQQHER